MSDWIKCSESLPKFGAKVLAVCANETDAGDIYMAERRQRTSSSGWFWDLPHDDDWYTSDYFTHWMPLPEPPKDEP